jgi:hypothetical protein
VQRDLVGELVVQMAPAKERDQAAQPGGHVAPLFDYGCGVQAGFITRVIASMSLAKLFSA